MKKLTLAALILLTAGCSSTSQLTAEEAKHKRVSEVFDLHATKASLAKSFCGGGELGSFHESMYYYSFRCEDGRFFTLKTGK